MTDDLIMLDDEDIDLVDDGTIAIVIAPHWQRIRNIITLPKEDAIKLAINILTQADLQ